MMLRFCLSSLAVHTLGFRIESSLESEALVAEEAAQQSSIESQVLSASLEAKAFVASALSAYQPTEEAEEAAQQIGLHASDLSAPVARVHEPVDISTVDATLPWGTDMYAVKSEDVRAWLSNRSHFLQGEIAQHPRYSEFPIKGVGAFLKLGPAGILDATHFENWDPDLGTFELDMNWVTAQSGVPEALPDGSGGPFVPGTALLRVMRSQAYWNKFVCPPRPLLDGDNCSVISSVFGAPYWMDIEGHLGNAALKIVKEDGGSVWRRHTWIRAPWRSNDDTWQTENDPWHSYDLLQIMDENYVINEENFAIFMEKLNGQDILGWTDYFK